MTLTPEQIADGWKLTERSDGSGTLLYTLKSDGYRRGKEVFVNDQTILIEGADHRELAQSVLAALSPDRPQAEPVAWRWQDGTSYWRVTTNACHADDIQKAGVTVESLGVLSAAKAWIGE